MRPIHRGSAARWSAGLELAYRWHDADVLQLSVTASNSTFTGGAFPYLSTGEPSNLATMLDGFPANSSDVRELEFGTRGERYAGGYVRLRFSCRDLACHAIVEVHIESKNEYRTETPWNEVPQIAQFLAEVEPSAVDEFVRELRQLNEDNSSRAWLRFVST